jgi:hypothetical protein
MAFSTLVAVKDRISRSRQVRVMTGQAVESRVSAIESSGLLEKTGTLNNRGRGEADKQLIVDRQFLGCHLVGPTMTVAATIH